jgi:phosphoglycolate phosphatase-like HAD superfamily hydrolase
MSKHLVLWDIDKTLVDLEGVGGEWYSLVFQRVLGIPLQTLPSFAGRTERGIATDLLAAHGIEPSADLLARMFAELTAVVDADSLESRGRALPGALAAVSALARRDDVVQSLVTGNLPAVAGHKLTAFGLDVLLGNDFAGFGDASEVRADLVATAVERFSEVHGTPRSVIVIGDTPDDIGCARAHSAVAVGVTTGHFDARTLWAAGADEVLPDLVDTARVLTLLDR